MVKSRRLRPLLPRIPVLFANIAQAAAIAETAPFENTETAAAALRALGARAGVVTAGPRPVTVWQDGDARVFPVLAANPRDVTGAGDAMISGTLLGLIEGLSLYGAARLGLGAAAITVECETTTAPDFTPAMLERRATR